MQKIVFIEKVQETPTDWSFRFSRPDGYEYLAGQYAVLRMTMRYPDDRHGARTCSLSSSPQEDYLQFTFTIRDTGFKKTLMELEPGEEVMVSAARGVMTAKELQRKKLCLIAGGIGVAPFRGIIREEIFAKKSELEELVLIYTDKTLEELAFKKEFDSWVDQGEGFFKAYYSLTRYDDSHNWDGLLGRFNQQMLSEVLVNDLLQYSYMVCGMPEMVMSAKEVLLMQQVPEEHIHLELFTGY